MLPIDCCHSSFRVARACDGFGSRDLVDAGEVFFGQFYVNGVDVLFQILAPLCSGDGHDVSPLRHHPRESELRGLAAFARGNFFHTLYQTKVLLKILFLKAWEHAPPIILRQVFRLLKLSCQKTATERAISDEADPKLAARRQNICLYVARP